MEKLAIFIDGNDSIRKRSYTQDLIVDTYSLEKDQVVVSSGRKFDVRYPIVNMADALAYYIYQNRKSMKKNSHRREFLF